MTTTSRPRLVDTVVTGDYVKVGSAKWLLLTLDPVRAQTSWTQSRYWRLTGLDRDGIEMCTTVLGPYIPVDTEIPEHFQPHVIRARSRQLMANAQVLIRRASAAARFAADQEEQL